MKNALTQTLQAMADPTRRAILQMLNTGDLTAGEIAARFAISAPSVSHHLSVLKAADLVAAQRNGQKIIFLSIGALLAASLGSVVYSCIIWRQSSNRRIEQ